MGKLHVDVGGLHDIVSLVAVEPSAKSRTVFLRLNSKNRLDFNQEVQKSKGSNQVSMGMRQNTDKQLDFWGTQQLLNTSDASGPVSMSKSAWVG